jgi:hypothetical protein
MKHYCSRLAIGLIGLSALSLTNPPVSRAGTDAVPLVTRQAVGGKVDLSTAKEADAAATRSLNWLRPNKRRTAHGLREVSLPSPPCPSGHLR